MPLQKFKNSTSKDLKFAFNSEDYFVKAGEERLFEDFLARHAAKKLADLVFDGNPIDRESREKLAQSFLGEIIDNRVKDEPLSIKQQMEKDVASYEAKIKVEKTVEKEEEFADLKEKSQTDLEKMDKRTKEYKDKVMELKKKQ